MTSALTTRSFESQDVQVVADKQSLPNLDGLVIDFVKTNLLTGTGQMLLADAVKRTITVSDNIAIDAVVVDAISQQAETLFIRFNPFRSQSAAKSSVRHRPQSPGFSLCFPAWYGQAIVDRL
jgi:hypothetical protein